MDTQPPASPQDEQSSPPADDELQFEHAETAQPGTPAVVCVACKQPVVDCYYQVTGQTFCASCREELMAVLTGGSPLWRFVKAIALGVAGAAMGAFLYYLVRAATHAEWGLVAIVLGLIVGIAVRTGSENRGGWPYQSMAILLTYLAIAFSYYPEVSSSLTQAVMKHNAAAATAPAVGKKPQFYAASTDLTAKQKALVSRVSARICLELPFRSSVMGYIIKAIALYEAWKFNRRRRIVVKGPFALGPQPAAPASGAVPTS